MCLALEDTQLYSLIAKGTRNSLTEAWKSANDIPEEDIKIRSRETKATYLHQIVTVARDVYRRYGNLDLLVPLIYRLAIRGINVNAQNTHGNTCLHMACLIPNASGLCEHLIRIGVDPSIQNKKQCRIIHTIHNHVCHMVKGQASVKSGIWNAVDKEDAALVENLLKTWCRVNVQRNNTLYKLAEETANLKIIRLLAKYELTSELAMAAFACDVPLVKTILKSGKADITQMDESRDVPRPLTVALDQLGDRYSGVIRCLEEAGMEDSKTYIDKLKDYSDAFEKSEFYQQVEDGNTESLEAAIAMLGEDKVDIRLKSYQESTKGWTYLHYIVARYQHMKEEDEEKARLLLRMLYRLALLGIDVHTRDSNGDTALVLSAKKLDQSLLTHLIRIGCSPMLCDNEGRAVNAEVYADKGKMVFDKKYKMADLPGLWVAVESDDIGKTERWLKSWCRVNTRQGERRLMDVAKALKRTEIVKLLEQYEHINEFVCATMACDMKRMMDILALGRGEHKVNTVDDFFHVGFTWDRHAEFMVRPIIVTTVELCTPQVVDFLLKFGADLSKEHEESYPCGPSAFWAFRDHVSNENALVVAKHANVSLRNEEGATMLHSAIRKKRTDGKAEIVRTLLDRGINVAARDCEGSTARDYITIFNVDNGEELQQIIDDHVLELVNSDQHYLLESFLVESYDHIIDIRGTKRNKTAREIAELKEYKEIVQLLHEFDDYTTECGLLHESARKGDLVSISKLSGEKRCSSSLNLLEDQYFKGQLLYLGVDKAGRSLLHNAVLHEHIEVVTFLVEQYPQLINVTDNLNRTPLHLCVCLKERHHIWPILQDGGADPNMVDVNNMSVYDYVRELEAPTARKDRPRGRRHQDYRPADVIELEKAKRYGVRAVSHDLKKKLSTMIKRNSLKEIEKATQNFKEADLSIDDLDITLLQLAKDNEREEQVKHLIANCSTRPDGVPLTG